MSATARGQVASLPCIVLRLPAHQLIVAGGDCRLPVAGLTLVACGRELTCYDVLLLSCPSGEMYPVAGRGAVSPLQPAVVGIHHSMIVYGCSGQVDQ